VDQITQLAAQTRQEWTPVFPAPNHEPNLKQENQLTYMLKGCLETARFAYKDAEHNVLGYVVRLEDKNGNKITPTLTFCTKLESEIKSKDKDHDQLLTPDSHSSISEWRWQGFGNDRPLYGLEQLKDKPNASVLIVEGEKTCDAARANPLFKDMSVVTWNGGCGAVQKSDWSVLKDRHVIVWPDNDKPGLNASHKISEILKAQGSQNVQIVDLPATLPHKWDLADKVPDGANLKDIFEKTLTASKEKAPTVVDSHQYNNICSKELKESIDKIVKTNSLNLSFDGLQNKDYQYIAQLQNNFQQLYSSNGMDMNKDWILKRATYMVFHIKEFGQLSNSDEERLRNAMVASTIFANQTKPDLSINTDAHFKAIGIIKDHNKQNDLITKENSLQKEILGIDRAMTYSQINYDSLRQSVKEINVNIQKDLQQKDLAKSNTLHKDLSF
jgi:DNA primase